MNSFVTVWVQGAQWDEDRLPRLYRAKGQEEEKRLPLLKKKTMTHKKLVLIERTEGNWGAVDEMTGGDRQSSQEQWTKERKRSLSRKT